MKAPVKWFGGKGKMIQKILPLIPHGKVYVEPFMGAASMFFARIHAPVEVINDLDCDLVNLFRCLQDKDKHQELKHRLLHTLYSIAEFEKAINILKEKDSHSDIDKAWAFFVAMNQGFSGEKPKGRSNWGRVFIPRQGISETTNKWIMRLSMLDDWHKRLLTAQIDNRDAIEVIEYWDTQDTVFYVDPPYVPDTRIHKSVYAYEPDEDFHARLVDTLLNCNGAVVLSGYKHDIYNPLTDNGWEMIEYKTACYAAGRTRKSGLQGKGNALKKSPRTECIWVNPRAIEMNGDIFGNNVVTL